ncbi:MAG: aminomethyl-transferring glycine dehydrogenase subunit GcvPA [Spirochaetales bacterium]|nr:aminomethyl-transferring glycine dehydrogenase subunit GcvPA [Spirochaetales bacterium]
MPFVPNTDADRAAMLAAIGAGSVEELFADVPAARRFPKLELPKALSELEILRELDALAKKNEATDSGAWFVGGGAYSHFVPAMVPALAGRGEFLTAYTPYQAEVSQGTLQAIFEYQSMAAALFGVETVNASHYDGATALAEAVLMALHAVSGRPRVMIPAALHPEYREVLATYLEAFEVEVVEWKGSAAEAAKGVDARTACFVVQWPDFEGEVHELSGVADAVHAAGALLLVHVDPIFAALAKSPGSLGADIVTAEGQALGNALYYGGPYLGMMGATAKLVRKMPGRIVGEAKDKTGRTGYVLTLSAREQHIRREKAVSNICSNQGLVMLQSTIYMAALGKHGLARVARLCWDKAHYAAAELGKLPGFKVVNRTFFKEFLVHTPVPAAELVAKLEKRGVHPGLALSRWHPERTHELLVAVTEMNTKEQIDLLARSLAEASK